MNLRDILQDVDAIIPNQITAAIKVRWINQIQRQLYREIPFQEAIYPFQVECDRQFYTVPSDCRIDTIRAIVIDEVSYDKEKMRNGQPSPYFWEEVAGTIMIYPVPKSESTGYIYYRNVPKELMPNKLDDTPELPDDYHQILVDGCISRVAKAEGDSQRSTVFDDSYNALIRKAKSDLTRNDYHVIHMEYGW